MELVVFARKHRKALCEDCQRRLSKSPLRLLDCKEEGCRVVMKEAPQIVDWLDEASKEHFMQLIEYLDELSLPYELNPHLVRGLDYYTRTVFEIVPDRGDGAEPGAQSSLGAGGRYDGLVELMGGREETPAVGFAVGIERAILEMKRQEIEPPGIAISTDFLCADWSGKRVVSLCVDLKFARLVCRWSSRLGRRV